MEVVALIEDLAVDSLVQLEQPPYLAVLLRDELLVHRRDFDEEILIRKIEIGCEELDGFTGIVVLDSERARLVIPWKAVEIEEERELPLTVVSEIDGVGRRLVRALRRQTVQVTPASVAGMDGSRMSISG